MFLVPTPCIMDHFRQNTLEGTGISIDVSGSNGFSLLRSIFVRLNTLKGEKPLYSFAVFLGLLFPKRYGDNFNGGHLSFKHPKSYRYKRFDTLKGATSYLPFLFGFPSPSRPPPGGIVLYCMRKSITDPQADKKK